jgi:hypothetical protein
MRTEVVVDQSDIRLCSLNLGCQVTETPLAERQHDEVTIKVARGGYAENIIVARLESQVRCQYSLERD